MLECVRESCTSRPAGNNDQCRALAFRTRARRTRDKERYVRGLAKMFEGDLKVNDLSPAYEALKKLCSKSTSRVSSIRAVDGGLISDMADQQAHWTEYFEQLYMAKPPNGQFQFVLLQTMVTDLGRG